MPLQAKSITLSFDGEDHCFDANDTRETIVEKLGQPIDTSVATSRQKRPLIFVYDEHERFEFHFHDDKLRVIFQDNEYGVLFSVSFIPCN